MEKEQLKSEFAEILKNGITFSGQVGDYIINQSVFDWLLLKLYKPEKKQAKTFEECCEEVATDGFDWRDYPYLFFQEAVELFAKEKTKKGIRLARTSKKHATYYTEQEIIDKLFNP